MSIFKKVDINDLSSVEVEIYKFIVNNLESVVFMRVRDIAENANVSPTSVFRFIQKMGFSSFPEFKMYIKSRLNLKENIKDGNQLNIEGRINSIDINNFHPDIDYQLSQAAKKLLHADSIVFLGMGASGSIAKYAARKFANLDYFSIGISELTYPFTSLLKNNRNNFVICLSVSGETRELIEALAGIDRTSSVYTYGITAGKNSTLSRMSDYSLEYYIKEERKDVFFDLTSQIPALLIIETLFGYLHDLKLEKINDALK